MLNINDPDVAQAISRGVGEELRHRRRQLGLSQSALGELIPSKLGDRSILYYEGGLRRLDVLRLVELAEALGAPAPTLLERGLQRAQQALGNLTISVDLRQLLSCTLPNVAPLHPWAKNRARECEDGIAVVTPSGVRELAAAIGYPPEAVAVHLAKFLPDGQREVDGMGHLWNKEDADQAEYEHGKNEADKAEEEDSDDD